jgi:hypothetical protein
VLKFATVVWKRTLGEFRIFEHLARGSGY